MLAEHRQLVVEVQEIAEGTGWREAKHKNSLEGFEKMGVLAFETYCSQRYTRMAKMTDRTVVLRRKLATFISLSFSCFSRLLTTPQRHCGCHYGTHIAPILP